MGLLDAWRTTRQNIIDSKPTYSRIFPAQDYSAGVYRGNTNNPVVASSTGGIVGQPAPITRRIIDNGGSGEDFDDNNTSFVDDDVFQALAQTGAGVRGEDYDRPNSFFESSNVNEAQPNVINADLNQDLNVLTGREMSDLTQNPDNNSFSLGKAGDLATNVGDFALNAIKGGPMGTAYTMATNDAFPREALPAAAALAMAPMIIPGPGAGILGTIGGALNNAGAYHDFGNDPDINSAGGEISYQNGLMSAPTDAPGGYVYQDGEKSNINSLAAMDPNTPINVGGGEYSSAGDLYQGLSQTGAGVEGEDYNRSESFGDSDGGGDGGGTVICTELHRQKLLLDDVYDVDREVGLYFEKNDPLVVKGYHYWAVPLARLMSKSKIVTALVKPIALPWANQMYAQKHNLKANLIGKLMLLIGVPFCRFLGSLLTKIEKVTPNDTRTRSA